MGSCRFRAKLIASIFVAAISAPAAIAQAGVDPAACEKSATSFDCLRCRWAEKNDCLGEDGSDVSLGRGGISEPSEAPTPIGPEAMGGGDRDCPKSQSEYRKQMSGWDRELANAVKPIDRWEASLEKIEKSVYDDTFNGCGNQLNELKSMKEQAGKYVPKLYRDNALWMQACLRDWMDKVSQLKRENPGNAKFKDLLIEISDTQIALDANSEKIDDRLVELEKIQKDIDSQIATCEIFDG